MSVTTPLTTFADDQASAAQHAVDGLKAQLLAQDTALPALRLEQQQAIARLTADAAEEAELRRQLGAIEMPADSEPIVTQLENVLVAEQGDREDVGRTSDALDDAVRARAATANALANATATASVASAAAVAEHVAAARVESWLVAAGSSEVTQAVSDATAAPGRDPHNAAKSRLQGILDTAASGSTMYDLFARRSTEAAERAQAPADAAAAALAARQALLATQAPTQGALAQAETAYAVEVARLQELAEDAVKDVDAALASLQAIATAPAPSAAETGAITAAVDDAKPLAPLEGEVHDANREVREARLTFDEAVWAGIAEDPDFDGQTSSEVQTERDALTAKQGVLRTKVDAYRGAHPEHLDTYEAALPDAVKDQVVAFFAAERTLARVAAFGSGVPTDVAAAASDLADARRTAAEELASGARLDREVEQASATGLARAAVASERSAALLRGEGALQ